MGNPRSTHVAFFALNAGLFSVVPCTGTFRIPISVDEEPSVLFPHSCRNLPFVSLSIRGAEARSSCRARLPHMLKQHPETQVIEVGRLDEVVSNLDALVDSRKKCGIRLLTASGLQFDVTQRIQCTMQSVTRTAVPSSTIEALCNQRQHTICVRTYL